MSESHNPDARAAWDHVIAAIGHAIKLEGGMNAGLGQISMTRDQADVLFPLSMLVAGTAGEVRVIREQQSSKSQLNKKLRSVK